MSGYQAKITRVRAQLASEGAAGALLSTPDNIFYATGFSSVMDGWHLVEPIAAVFVPTDAASPVVLILPEASVISPIVSERGGHPVHFDRLATFDMLNFCETARAEDAHLALPEDLLAELGGLMELVESQCEPNIIQTIAASLSRHVAQDELILFDDLRVAARSRSITFHWIWQRQPDYPAPIKSAALGGNQIAETTPEQSRQVLAPRPTPPAHDPPRVNGQMPCRDQLIPQRFRPTLQPIGPKAPYLRCQGEAWLTHPLALALRPRS